MAFRFNPIFIKSAIPQSDEKLLQNIGLSHLIKGNVVDFFDTNKQYERVFVGANGACNILSNGALAYQAFDAKNPFIQLENAEIVAIIWDETLGIFGFCCIQNGEMMRKVLVVEGVLECDEGTPLPEESLFTVDKVFTADEIAEMLDADGEEELEERLKAETVWRVADVLAKKYMGMGFVDIKEGILLHEYR